MFRITAGAAMLALVLAFPALASAPPVGRCRRVP
jgi:hypothetical protein